MNKGQRSDGRTLVRTISNEEKEKILTGADSQAEIDLRIATIKARLAEPGLSEMSRTLAETELRVAHLPTFAERLIAKKQAKRDYLRERGDKVYLDNRIINPRTQAERSALKRVDEIRAHPLYEEAWKRQRIDKLPQTLFACEERIHKIESGADDEWKPRGPRPKPKTR